MEVLTGAQVPNPKKIFPKCKHIIDYAFSIKGRHYFQFNDPLNMPYDRALKSLPYYREFEMNTGRELLIAHTDAVDNIFSKTQLTMNDLVDLKHFNNLLKERLNLPKEPELMYKLAAVVFFDQYENPDTYEFKYGEAKIKHWKKEADLKSFFLSKPLRTLIPYLDYVGENLITYSQMVEGRTEVYKKALLPRLSEEQRTLLHGK